MRHGHLESLDQRVARPERSLGLWRAGAVLAVVIWTLGVAGQGHPDVVRADRFELMDDEGRVRARLSVEEGGPELHLLDETGVHRASLVHDAQQTGLFLQDGEGDTRVGAAYFAHGGGGYALHGPGGEGALVLYLKEQGTLTHYGPGGEVLARFPESP